MRFSYLIVLATLIFCGCSSDEPGLPDEPVTEDNVYLELNKWIYGQMNRQYLWREDLPDSIKCDYNLVYCRQKIDFHILRLTIIIIQENRNTII
mgnify:CR=1 FL=1